MKHGGAGIVLGGGVAGLAAAGVLSEHFEHVTVVERTNLAYDLTHSAPANRAEHLQLLLPQGVRSLDALFPGLMDGLSHPRALLVTGSSLAAALARRLEARGNVELIDHCDAIALVADSGNVTGAYVQRRLRTSPPVLLEGSLVVDATGQNSRSATWLEPIEYQPPAESRVEMEVSFASQLLRPCTPSLHDVHEVAVGRHQPRTMRLGRHGCDRWILTIGGGVHKRTRQRDGLLALATAMAPSDVCDAIESSRPVGDVTSQCYRTCVRRHYEKLRHFPPGLLVIGDALCTFNPISVSAVTLAVMEAELLRGCLRAGHRRLTRRYFRSVATLLEPAWRLSAAGHQPPAAGPVQSMSWVERR